MEKIFTDNIISLSSQFEKEKKYWLNKLPGVLGKSKFPYDFTWRDRNGYAMESSRFGFPCELSAKLIGFSNGSDKNLFMILLTGLIILLSKYTGNKDIVITAPIYRQNVVGELINTILIIRNKVDDRMSFKELLLNVKKSVVEANENSNYPVEKLLYLLDMSDPGETSDLFKTAILLKNIHDRRYIEDIKHDTIISFCKSDKMIEGIFEYNTLLYKQETIARIINHLINLEFAIISNLDLPIDEIDILSGQERQQLLYDFNNSAGNWPGDRTIKRLFEEQVDRSPTKLALTFDNPEEKFSHSLTFMELNKKAKQLGKLLRLKGVDADTITAIIVRPSIEMVIGILGILNSGGAFLPIDPGTPAPRVKHILDDSSTGLILSFTGRQYEEVKKIFAGEIVNLDETGIEKLDFHDLTIESAPSHLLYVIYTSGTTGKSRGVIIKNKSLVNYIHWFSETAGLSEKDSTILTQSLAFDLGYTTFFSALLKGCRLFVMPRDNYLYPDALINYIIINQISYIKVTPSFFSTIINSPYFSKKTSLKLRLILLGGEAIQLKDVEKAHSLCNDIQIMNHYGPTETTIGSIARIIDFSRFEEYKKNPTIGKPIYNTKAFILGKNFDLLPLGVPGELCISGKGLASGYLNKPGLTMERFLIKVPQLSIALTDEISLYRTGDLARWMPDGNIEFLGRMDKQVKVRGYRVELGDVENSLLSREGIKEVFAVVKKDEGHGTSQICAYFAADREISISDLREYLSARLPDYMIPAYFVQLDRLPLTLNGKLDEKSLPAPGLKKGNEFAPPCSEMEKRVAAIMSDVLNTNYENIGLDSNFFELGGHSLKAVNLVTKIQRQLNVKMKLIDIFTNPTPRVLSRIAAAAARTVYSPINLVEKKEYYRLSPAQRRVYFLQQFNSRGTTYNVPQVIPLHNSVKKDKVEETFGKLVKRHENFRTSFEIIDGEVVQKIHADVNFKIEYFDYSGMEEKKRQQYINGLVSHFDLGQAPLLRVFLLFTGTGRNILLVDMHHIMTDGVSRRLLVDDFMAFSRGECLPALPLQYKDYAEWQNNASISLSLKEQEEYWVTVFSQKAPRLDMFQDYKCEKPLHEHKGEEIEFRLGSELAKQVNEIVRTKGVTLFIFLVAVYDILLAKYCNRDDIVVGTGVSGRTHPDLENIVGMFINSLALRNYPRDNKTFSGFLDEVKESTLRAFENQDYQFDMLVEKLNLPRELNRSPLFDSVFQVQNQWEVVDARAGDSEMSRHLLRVRTIKYELTWVIVEYIDDICFTVQYSGDLYKRETIEKLFEHYREILGIVLADEKIKIIDIELETGLREIGEPGDRSALDMLSTFNF